MTSEERRSTLETNIGVVHVGDKFSSATELYKKLGLDADTSNAHTKKNAVQKFLTWEVEGGHSIVIKDIFATPLPADGRTVNPGGSTGVYQPFIKPLLANYAFDGKTDTTWRQIIRNCYGIDLPKPTTATGTGVAHKQRYMQELYNRLRDATKTAMRALSKDGVLEYRERWEIKQSSRCKTAKVAKLIAAETTLLEFLRKSECLGVLTEALDDDRLIEFLCGALGKDSRTLTKSISLFTFAKMHFRDKSSISQLLAFSEAVDLKALATVDTLLEAWKAFEAPPRKIDARHATAKEGEMLKAIQDNAIEVCGYTTVQFNNSIAYRQEVYAVCEVVQRLLGMERVWKGLNVKKKRATKAAMAKYPNNPSKDKEELMRALEPKMTAWVKSVSYNPRVSYTSHMAKKPHWGEIFPGQKDDIEVRYLATDEALNLWHCKLFNLAEDNEYFTK